MSEADSKTYLVEIKMVTWWRELARAQKKIGNSYDLFENERLKKRHVGNSYDVYEK